eukprot:2873027-Pyramimonas_sp.AAC.2
MHRPVISIHRRTIRGYWAPPTRGADGNWGLSWKSGVATLTLRRGWVNGSRDAGGERLGGEGMWEAITGGERAYS